MTRVLLSGAGGRMGREVAAAAKNYGFEIVCGVDPRAGEGFSFPVYASFDEVLESAEVLIDFSLPRALPAMLGYLKSRPMPAVLCATKYSEEDENAVRVLSKSMPVFRSANMSLGVAVLRRLAREAARMLNGFDIEIIERHHSKKADAPSGTALMLLKEVESASSRTVYGRDPQSPPRAREEIGLHAVRGGTVAGDHEVGFYGDNETVMLRHAAQSRAVFAAGALKAARFLISRPAGLYTMDDYAERLLNGR